MMDFKNKKIQTFYKIISVIVALIITYKGFHLLFESGFITKNRFIIYMVSEILIVFTIKAIQIKLKKRKNIFEKLLNEPYFAEYKSVQEKINLSQLSFRKKREVMRDVLEMLITAQESGKSIKEVVPDSEQFSTDIVDAYGKWNYGLKEILLGFIYVIFFILFTQLLMWGISFLINTDHNFFHIKLFSSSLFLAFAYFCIPIANWVKQRNTKLNKNLFLSIIGLSLLIIYVILAIFNFGLEWNFLDFFSNQFQLIPNLYVLIQYLIFTFILWLLMVSIRKKVNLDFSQSELIRNPTKNNINRNLFIVLIILILLLISSIVILFTSFNWKEKSIYNTKKLSLNVDLLTKTGANNQNTGLYPDTGLPKLTTIAWKKQIITEDQKYIDELAYNEGVLYYTDFHTIYALSSFNENPIWRYDSHRMINTGFTITRDAIYFGANSFMFAIDKVNGKELWRVLTDGSVETNPVVENGIIYFGSEDFFVYALNAISGEMIWKFDSGYHIQSDPAIYNGILYIGNDDGFLYALDAKTGKQIWKYKSLDSIKNSISVFENSVFLTNNSAITKIDSKSGKEIWKYLANFGDSPKVPIADNLIFANTLGSSDNPIGKTIAIDVKTGKEVWHFSSDKSKDAYGYSLVVANHIVYLRHSDHFLYALDAYSGKKIWEFNTGNGSFDNIAIGDGMVFVGDVQDGYLCALK